MLQHPIDFLLFPFLACDRVEHVSLLIIVIFLPLLCVSNSGTSAVCLAEYRLTLSSCASSTNCFPHAFNTSFRESRPVLSNQPHAPILSSTFCRQQCCQSGAARCPTSFLHAIIPVHLRRVSQSCTNDTSDLAPDVPFSITEQFSQFWHAPTQRMLRMFVREMSAHVQLSFVRCDARFACIVFLNLASSEFMLSSCRDVAVRKIMCMALPIKRSVWCSCCICSNLSWSSLVPRSPNYPSSRFAVMSMQRLDSML